MRKRIGLLISFLIGTLCGIVLMGLLSMRASRTYLQMVRSVYVMEQEGLGGRARKDSDLPEALIHYSNVVKVTSRPGSRAFDPSFHEWRFAFPFVAPVLDKIGEPNREETARAKIEAINRGKLGVILEEVGRSEEARREYLAAARLLGVTETDGIKRMARTMLKGDADTSHTVLQLLRQ